MPVHFGLQTPQEGATYDALAAHWREADRLGFDSVWLDDHFYSVVRPRAGLELARLRYRHEFGRSPRNDGKFTSEQTTAIVEPLLVVSRQAPPLAEIYELLAHVYAHSVDVAPPELLALLAEGERKFGRSFTD